MPLNPEDLEDRIAKARAAGAVRRTGPTGSLADVESGRAMGGGMRVGAEFVSAVVVGGALGWVIDRWLGTAPFGLLILLLSGFAVALVNVWRRMNGSGGIDSSRAGGMQAAAQDRDTEEVDGESS